MVLGVASVITATRQHQTVGMLISPLHIRLWLSRGRPKGYRRIRNLVNILLPLWLKDDGEKSDKYENVPGFQGLPLESSISALKATTLPRHLLDLAVIVFLVGFGLYVRFQWSFNIEQSGESYRKVFIAFITVVSLFVVYDRLIEAARVFDDDMRNSVLIRRL